MNIPTMYPGAPNMPAQPNPNQMPCNMPAQPSPSMMPCNAPAIMMEMHQMCLEMYQMMKEMHCKVMHKHH